MNRRILVIDDDDEMRSYMSEALTAEGYQVATATNGEEGLQALQTRPADLVILDLFMPGMEGFETIMELRRISPTPAIMAVSGGGHFASADMLAVASKLGARKTLPKPFTCPELIESVRDLLAHKSAETV